jgi:hypothetical protein
MRNFKNFPEVIGLSPDPLKKEEGEEEEGGMEKREGDRMGKKVKGDGEGSGVEGRDDNGRQERGS